MQLGDELGRHDHVDHHRAGRYRTAVWLFTRRTKPLHETPEEVATQIEKFLDGTAGTYDWDDFICFELADPYLEKVRQLCVETNTRYPTSDGKGWCNERGAAVLRQLAADVREYGRTGVAPLPPN
jgi:hypothetical protein